MSTIVLPSVPPYYANPKLDYAISQKIQAAFQAKLPWLDRAYHLAKVGIDAEKDLGYPQIHANNTTPEHFDIRADDKIGAYSFLEIERPYLILYNDDTVKYFLSAVFWCNLDLVDPVKTYDYTSELIYDASEVLRGLEAGNVLVETRPERVFDKYSGIKQILKQFLMRRFSGFKFTFEIVDSYTDNC